MAQVLSIQKETPKKNERYLIDTNVWFWFTYASNKIGAIPNTPSKYQLEHYPKFIESILKENAQPCHSSLSLTELANIIEKTEFDIYKVESNQPYLERKAFRKLQSEKQKVISEIEAAWSVINQISCCIDSKVDKSFMDSSFEFYKKSPLDPYDAVFLQTMSANKIDYIVTDDIDFQNVNSLILLTANPGCFAKNH